jgi:hypothetical protein
MAHFAEIENGIVKRVLAVSEAEALHLPERYGGEWVQTYTNAEESARKGYAGIGYSWREDLNAFVPPKPHGSWHLDSETSLWEPPVAKPSSGFHEWDEENLEWVEHEQQQ